MIGRKVCRQEVEWVGWRQCARQEKDWETAVLINFEPSIDDPGYFPDTVIALLRTSPNNCMTVDKCMYQEKYLNAEN